MSSKEYASRYYQKNKLRISLREKQKVVLRRETLKCRMCDRSCVDIKYKKYCSEACQERGIQQYEKIWKREARKRGWFVAYKMSLGGCQRCGYSKCLAALDFHHIDRSTKERSPAALANCSEEVGMAELSKCILVCKNCHYELHEDKKIKEHGDVF